MYRSSSFVIVLALVAACPPAMADDFPQPRVGAVFQLNQVEKGYQRVRQHYEILGTKGDVVNYLIEGSDDGKPMPTATWSMRYLFQEHGHYLTTNNDCEITSGADRLKTIAAGTDLTFEVQCRLKRDNQTVYTATQRVDRKITGKEKIKVAAGNFDAVVIEDDSAIKLVQNGKASNRTSHKKFWFVPSIGFYVRWTEWDGTVPGKPPLRFEADQVR